VVELTGRTWGAGAPGESAAAGASFLARQPIYDRELNVFAYELLFRDPSGAAALDNEVATASTMMTALADVGLKALVGERLALVNVTERFVLDDYAVLIPSERIAFELLEDTAPSGTVVERLRALGARGQMIVLDDFVWSERQRPLVEVAHLVKLDVLALGERGLRDHVGLLRPFGVKLLAEKVETHEMFELCRALGFDYFQGFFFARPRIVEGQTVPPTELARLRLIATLQDPLVSLEEIVEIITHDVGLSFRLLRLVNSAAYGLNRRVGSLRQAIMYLGLRQLRSWASILVLASTGRTPSELTTTALIRARTCQLVSQARGDTDADTAFTVGLFSLIDAYFHARAEDIIATLPFSDDLRQAILAYDGPHGRTLAAVIALERGAFDAAADALDDAETLQAAYLEAVRWADETQHHLA
jgi:EAL and modified HD-GYP domain-containing signal transduction protein